MRAAQNIRYGPPSSIEIVELPIPTAEVDEILIKVAYSSVNRTDVGFLYARPWVTRLFTGIVKPRYPSLGCEFAGVVEAVGAKVEEFVVGDRVYGFDDALFGGHSQYMAIRSSKMVAKVPDGVELRAAAVATEGAHYAQAFINKVELKQGDRVFVHGATGGIGSAMVQLLVARGIRVTASSTTAQLGLVASLGAEQVIDWQTNALASIDDEFNHFFDAVGKASFGDIKQLIKPGGSYISSELGQRGENVWRSLLNPVQRITSGRNVYFPMPSTNKSLLAEISQRLASQEFTPVIDKEYKLDDIREAYAYVETGQKVGNIVVRIE